MLSISALIEFLMNLLRDDDALAEFEQDPHGMLARHGLDGVSAEDVRDAATVIAGHDGVRCGSDDDHTSRGGGDSHHHDHHHDPVREIQHVTKTYEVDEHVTVKNSVHTYHDYDISYVDNSTNVVNIDDRDTLIVGEDVEVHDSFNGDSSANIVEDSFNEETHVDDSFNEVIVVDDDSTTINDSFNEVDVVAVDDDSITYNETNTAVENSFNSSPSYAPNQTTPAAADDAAAETQATETALA